MYLTLFKSLNKAKLNKNNIYFNLEAQQNIQRAGVRLALVRKSVQDFMQGERATPVVFTLEINTE